MKSTIFQLILLVFILSVQTANSQISTTNTSLDLSLYSDQKIYFISRNSVNVRSEPSLTGKVLGQLSLNDKIKIINPAVIYNNNLIEISIIESYDAVSRSEKYFVNLDFISQKITDYKEFLGKYFVVINVATETLRIYERVCPDNSCPNKMIMETEVAVGEDVDHPKEEPGKGRSILGSFRITGWAKFYEDVNGHYPAWYKEGYPDAPKADDGWLSWFAQKRMPTDIEGHKNGKMRGAFGWYTAFVGPEPFGQWVHGTVGWGSEKDNYIKKIKKGLINFLGNPRSSGCTRNNNEAIAFIRKMVDVGTPVIKIYAKEEILDSSFKNYSTQAIEWNYVLTKNRNHAIDREEVLKNLNIKGLDLDSFLAAKNADSKLMLDPGNPLNQVLEAGKYNVDSFPDAIAYTPGEKLSKLSRSVGRKGNVYGVPSYQMHGTYFVDAGVLEGYAHPDTILEISGLTEEVTPIWMKRSNLK